ncbi:unnamed protein product [Spodoptera exigua]|nr:unnamed protein product [Spodoptera exigua]
MKMVIQKSICLNLIDLPQHLYDTRRQMDKIKHRQIILFRESDGSSPQNEATASPTMSPTISPTTISPTVSSSVSPTVSKITSPKTSLDTLPLKPKISNRRRRFLLNKKPENKTYLKSFRKAYEDEKDFNLKSKIRMLVGLAMQDVSKKMEDTEYIKEKFRNHKPYKAGFVLSLIKKSRDVLNELFNVAIKHRAEWKALEQLKIFELIVHTNVDTTNLVKQLVDIHSGNTNFSLPNHTNTITEEIQN